MRVAALPGYGRPAAGQDLRPRALAERVLACSGDAARVVLAGHSASCQVVAHAAALAPGRVRGLVLVGPTTDPRAASWPRLAGRWLRTAAHETPRQAPALARQYHRTTLRTMARAMDAARHDRIDRTLTGVDGRLLVVRGRHDRICRADWGGSLVDPAAGGRLVTLPAGGHMVPHTHGGLVAPVVDALVGEAGA
ncbi:alpha/beta fold hydrolase [Nocardioides sp. TF02-7]|uniref:alpha/beta fold hydrolase n=1 Tax=Nocardioides sp. TF02-7 TaxID=2917724 RepID=UPI0031F5ACCD